MHHKQGRRETVPTDGRARNRRPLGGTTIDADVDPIEPARLAVTPGSLRRQEAPEAGVVYVIDANGADRSRALRVVASTGIAAAGYATVGDFLRQYDGHRPGCVLLELVVPDIGGLQALARFRAQAVALPVIMLTAYGNVPAAVASLKAGAIDFFEKPFSAHELLQCIHAALAADRTAARLLESASEAATRFDALSPRELEVVRLLAQGNSSKAIGRALQVSPRTIDAHRANILRKVGARSVAALVRLWLAARRE
jgi:FixJ family two-component response regulator